MTAQVSDQLWSSLSGISAIDAQIFSPISRVGDIADSTAKLRAVLDPDQYLIFFVAHLVDALAQCDAIGPDIAASSRVPYFASNTRQPAPAKSAFKLAARTPGITRSRL